MRTAKIYVNNIFAGWLIEKDNRSKYVCEYDESYQGNPISLTMPISQRSYVFSNFPPFFEGLLPEGLQLQALLRQAKLDSHDYFGQLLTVGEDLVGAVTVKEHKPKHKMENGKWIKQEIRHDKKHRKNMEQKET